MTTPFPDDDSVCEQCGYPLRELSPDGGCPECGLSIAASDPVHRTGLPWQTNISLMSLFQTAGELLLHPKSSYRKLRLGGNNHRERLFMLIIIAIASMWWVILRGFYIALMARLGSSTTMAMPHPLTLVIVMLVFVTLTYIEVLGVAYYGRRENWRSAFARAERVCCYASVGWWPASLFGLMPPPSFDQLANAFTDPAFFVHIGVYLFAMTCMLFLFEIFVYLGMRQVRFGNTAPTP